MQRLLSLPPSSRPSCENSGWRGGEGKDVGKKVGVVSSGLSRAEDEGLQFDGRRSSGSKAQVERCKEGSKR